MKRYIWRYMPFHETRFIPFHVVSLIHYTPMFWHVLLPFPRCTMPEWWKVHNCILDSEKFEELSPTLWRSWIKFGCCASRFGREGLLPPAKRLKIWMRMPETQIMKHLSELVSLGMIDKVDDDFIMHDWAGWQYLDGSTPKTGQDVSTERVRRLRERRKADAKEKPEALNETQHVTLHETVDVTLHETVGNVTCNGETVHQNRTEQKQNRTESETRFRVSGIPEQGGLIAKALDRICEAHPKTDGVAMGRSLMESQLSGAVNPLDLVAVIERKHKLYVESKKGTPVKYVKSLLNWVRDNGFMDPDPPAYKPPVAHDYDAEIADRKREKERLAAAKQAQ